MNDCRPSTASTGADLLKRYSAWALMLLLSLASALSARAQSYTTNKTVECGTSWTFDRPTPPPSCGSTNFQVQSVNTVTNSGPCPLVVTRTWVLVDDCGVAITWSETVTVVDSTPPIIHCPGPITIQACESVTVTYAAVADDTCCKNVTLTYSPPSGTVFPVGTTPVHVVATDCCGNTSSCDFLVVVACSSNPCPVDRIVLNTGFDPFLNTNLPIGASDPLWTIVADPDPGTTEPRPATTVPPYPGWQPPLPNSDWLSGYPVNSYAPNGPYDFQTKFCLKPGYTNITLNLCLRADDRADVFLNGNLVGSTPNPSFLTPTPTCITVWSGANPTFFQIGPNVLLVRVYNIYGAVMGLNAVGTVTGMGLAVNKPECCQPGGSICGVKFNDLNGDGIWQSTEPTIPGWTIQLSNGQTAVTDANGQYCFMNLAPGTYTVTEVPQSGWIQTAPAGGSYSLAVGLAQSINNVNFGNQLKQQPCVSIRCPDNIVVPCAGPGGTPVPFSVTASSSCGTTVTVVTMPPSPGPFPPGTTTVLCIATDAAGNSASCKFTVTVVDTAPPSVTCAPDKTVPFGLPWTFDLPDVKDDCCGTNVTIAPLATVTNGFCPTVITRTWVVTDCAGNTNTCSQTVTIQSPPSCQVFNTGMTGTNGNIPLPVGAPDPNYTLVAWPSGAGNTSVVQGNLVSVWLPNSAGSQWIGPDVDTTGEVQGVFHYQLKFVLCCSNSVALTGQVLSDDGAGMYLNGNFIGSISSYVSWNPVSITGGFVAGLNVLDFYVTNAYSWTGLRAELKVCTDPIVMGCAPDKTVECGTQWDFDPPLRIRSCCGGEELSIVGTTVSNLDACTTIQTRTWMVKDACGNSATCTQSVTIVDTTPPTIHCPRAITVQSCQEIPVSFDVLADDACCTNVTVICVPPSGSVFPVGTTPVHCIAIDCCGNRSTCEFLVIVNCPTSPCPVDRVLLNTGFNPISNTNLPIGAADPLWTIVADPDPGTTEPRPAVTVPPYPGWQPPLPNSDWISAYPPGAQAPNGPYDFQTKFCLLPGYTNITLNLCLRADDRADVFLNGNLVGSTPNPSFLTPTPTCLTVWSGANPTFFQIGPNVLLIRVYNVYGVVMGLNAAGTLSGSGLALNKPECCQPGGSICGSKFNDLNGDGIWQANEPPIPGWTIQLSNGQTAVTDSTGHYCFMNLAPGTYTLTEALQAGWVQTAPPGGSYTITVGPAQSINNVNFGNHLRDQPCVSIRCPDDIIVPCAGPGGTPVPFTVTASSSCGTTVTVTTYPASPGPFPPGTNTVLCVATDAAGNTASCKFNVIVLDTTPPAVTCAPDKTVPSGLPWHFDRPQVTDDCCGDKVTIDALGTVTNSFCPTVITRTWVVTDCAGNTNTCSQTVTILSPPPCQVFNTGMTGTNGDIPLGVGTPDPNYTLVSWPSGAGNTSVVQGNLVSVWLPNSSGSQWIGPDVNTLQEPPGVYHYQLKFVLCCSNLVALTGQVLSDDGCGMYLNGAYVGSVSSYSVWTSVNVTSGFVPGLNVLDFYVTNATVWTGLRAELRVCTTPLTMACTADKTVECGTRWDFDPPTRIRSCCGGENNAIASTTVSNVNACTSIQKRAWVVTDGCGNSLSCTQTVTVVDTTPPVIACAVNKVIPCGAAWNFDPPTASDSCSKANVSILTTVTNSVNPLVVTRTWVATDDCGNAANCSQTVTVLTGSSPFLCATPTFAVLAAGTTNDNFSGPEPASPSAGLLARLAAAGVTSLKGFDDCTVNSYFAHTFSNLPSCIVEAKLHVRFKACGDNCGNDAMGLSFTQPSGAYVPGWGRYLGNGNPGGPGLFNVYWTAGTVGDITLDLSALPNPSGPPTDLLPKLNLYGFLDLTLQDDSSIDFAVLELKSCCCQQDIVVSAPAGSCCAVVTYSPPNFTSCYPPVQVVFNPPSGTCFPLGTNLVQCTATDALGQVGHCYFKVIVRDSIPPVITYCPTNIVACLGDNGLAVMPNLVPQVVANDNCTPSAGLSIWQSPPPGSLVAGGTVTFTVTDAAGNSTTCTENIVVQRCCDVPPPALVLWLPFDEISGPTAINSAGGNNGTLMNTTSRNAAGYVNRSVCFDGITNYVKVPDYPAINPGTGDFSLDAWVKRSPNSGTAPRIIVDKRTSTYVGYSLAISFGNMVLQLGDPSGYSNYRDTGTVPADDQWHFVAVTVIRGLTNGGRFYVDGLPTGTFDPTAHPGSLNNTSAFQVGASPWAGNFPWMGCIDEVEMFRRALAPAEIRALYNALSLGKCRPSCSLPERTVFCANQASRTILARICNAGSVPAVYNYIFQPLPPGPGCNYPGPNTFSPASGNVVVGPHSCVTFPVTIGLPAGMPCGTSACYQMLVVPAGTTEVFTCQGSIYRSCKLCLQLATNIVTLPVGVTRKTGPLTIANTSSGPLDLSGARVSIVGPDLVMDREYVSINGLPPGMPLLLPPGTILPADGSLELSFDVQFVRDCPGPAFTILIEADTDGDGEMEPLASMELVNVIEPTDNVLAIGQDPSMGLVITWPAEGWVLQQSNSAAGGWSDVPGATSPFPVGPASSPSRFYRLRQVP